MIINSEDLPLVRREAAESPINLKIGTFDLFHPGHEGVLRFAQSLGGISVVGVKPDARVRQEKGLNRPIRPEQQRLKDVDDSGLTDYTFLLPEGIFSIARSILRLRPDTVVDHVTDLANNRIFRTALRAAGVEYVTWTSPRICSTTELIEKGALSSTPSGIHIGQT